MRRNPLGRQAIRDYSAVMAWRIHQNVIRGEIDNRQRGAVRGKIWLKGQPAPMLLDLQGNAAADLAGCLLTFDNPGPAIALDTEMNLLQRGAIGDLTASRKVRVFDIPLEEVHRRLDQGLPVPEHRANCLYLEWFSEANGRVVVESTDYKLTISAPAWRLTSEEEKQRQIDAANGFNSFMERLSKVLAAQQHHPPEDKEWDEFDYERFMRECDARTNKYSELLDKYMDHPDRDRLIAKEMGWSDPETTNETTERGSAGQDKGSPATSEAVSESAQAEHEVEDAFSSAEEPPELQPEPSTEGLDWVRKEDGYISHPLALRAMDGAVALCDKLKELGLEEPADEDLCGLLAEYQTLGAKLAGALDGLAYGRDLNEGPFIVACLKRALSHLHATQGALDQAAPKKLLPAQTVTSIRGELFAIREEVLRLMQEFRGKT